MNNRSKTLTGYLFLTPYLLVFTVFIIIPMVYGFALSFFRWEMLSPEPPRFMGPGNYIEAFKSEYFYKALWATVRFVVMSVPLNILVALITACGINAVPLKRQGFYRAAYFLPTILTISIVGILWTWFYNSEFGLFNSLLANFDINPYFPSKIVQRSKILIV